MTQDETTATVQVTETDYRRAAAAILHGAREDWDNVAQIVEDAPMDRQSMVALVVALTTILDGTLRAALGEAERDEAMEVLGDQALAWAAREAERG